MAKKEFDRVIKATLAIPAAERRRIRQALRGVAPEVAEHIRENAPFQDRTGAARAGVAVYVPEDASSAIRDAVAAAEALNEGKTATRSIDISGDVEALVATDVATYSEHLELAMAGRFAFLHSGLMDAIPLIEAAIKN